MPAKINLLNKKFGMLSVVKETDRRLGSGVVWECVCDCGNISYVKSSDLISKNTKSCGCTKRLIGKIRMKEINDKHSAGIGIAAFNHLFTSYKSGARKRNHSFELSKDELKFLVTQNCFYCGTKPSQIRRMKNCNGTFTYNGIDRIDSSVGYVKSNCVPCCWKCNKMKGILSTSEFLEHIAKIVEYKVNKL